MDFEALAKIIGDFGPGITLLGAIFFYFHKVKSDRRERESENRLGNYVNFLTSLNLMSIDVLAKDGVVDKALFSNLARDRILIELVANKEVNDMASKVLKRVTKVHLDEEQSNYSDDLFKLIDVMRSDLKLK
ncbi:MAG: hypothetical protein WD046_00625 [Paracoccaceae bacterium]